MSLPYGPNEAQAAQSVAEDLLAKLNAIAPIIDENHQLVDPFRHSTERTGYVLGTLAGSGV